MMIDSFQARLISYADSKNGIHMMMCCASSFFLY